MLTRRQRLRRTDILCLGTLRNFALYRAGWSQLQPAWRGRQFWVATNSNFLDTGVLEWCKVFADQKAQHHWRKTVGDQLAFLAQLLQELHMTQNAFDAYIQRLRFYRDKFIAHLDEENRMAFPELDAAVRSAQLLHQHFLANEDDCNAFPDAPRDAVAYYGRYFDEGTLYYPT